MDRFARAKLRRQIQELENEIAGLEEKEAELVEALGNPESYTKDGSGDAVKEMNKQLDLTQRRLPEAYQEWEEAGRRLEEG